MEGYKDISNYHSLQVETLFEDWDAAEPRTKESTNFGISTTDLFSRYSFYSKLVSDRTKWEQECNHYVVDFESILLRNSTNPIDPERMVKTFVHEKFNGELFRLTHNPSPVEDDADEPSVGLHYSSSCTLDYIVFPLQIHEVDELEIPVHVIKKKPATTADRPSESLSGLQACLPIRVEDIFRINIGTAGSCSSFELFGLQFRLVTFFGRICRVMKNEKWNQRYGMYSVDDASGRIVVHYNHLKKEFKGNRVREL